MGARCTWSRVGVARVVGSDMATSLHPPGCHPWAPGQLDAALVLQQLVDQRVGLGLDVGATGRQYVGHLPCCSRPPRRPPGRARCATGRAKAVAAARRHPQARPRGGRRLAGSPSCRHSSTSRCAASATTSGTWVSRFVRASHAYRPAGRSASGSPRTRCSARRSSSPSSRGEAAAGRGSPARTGPAQSTATPGPRSSRPSASTRRWWLPSGSVPSHSRTRSTVASRTSG